MSRSRTLAFFVWLAALVSGGPAAAATFVYVHDSGSSFNRIFALSLASDGSLTQVPNSPFSTNNTGTDCGGDCGTLAYSSKRKLLFAAGGDGISVLGVAKNGQLTLVPGSPFDNDGDFIGVAVVEKGSNTFVYAGDEPDGEVHAFKVQTDSTLVELVPPHIGVGDGPIMIAAAKGKLFVANQEDSTISAFAVQKNGGLVEAPGSPFSPGQDVFTAYPGPKGKVLYNASTETPAVLGFSVNKQNGALTPLADSPFDSAAGTGNGLAVGGSLLATADFSSGSTQLFHINKNDGSLSALGGAQPTGLDRCNVGTFDPKKGFLIFASDSPGDLRTYSVNGSTGTISQVDALNLGLDDPTKVLAIKR